VSRYALPLDGYDDASIWGYDQQGVTYYAQLRNESDSWDDPDIWLNGMNPIGSPERLAEMIPARTGLTPAEVARAMAAAKTAPEAAQLLEFADIASS
jgi:hypothetical protein